MSGRLPDHPVRLPLTLQTWAELTFLHWRVDPQAIQAHLPPRLRVDVLDGSAWVGITPFEMRDVRVPGVPPVPGWSSFAEVNVRTYVRGPDGNDGLWFLSLHCPRRAVVAVLRPLGLPYRLAAGRHERDDGVRRYRFGGPGAPGSKGTRLLGVDVTVGDPLTRQERTPLVEALTGRWNAYCGRAGRLLRVPVEHEPWPLHHATAGVHGELLDRPGTGLLSGDPWVHFSPGVHARIGPPALVGERVPATSR